MADAADIAQMKTEAILAGIEARLKVAREQQGRTLSGGICVDCDEPIPLARLAASPWAIRCIGCQQDAEARS